MMNQKKSIIAIVSLCAIVLTGTTLYCAISKKYDQVSVSDPIIPPIRVTGNPVLSQDQDLNIAYLVSKEDAAEFCDGSIMDSVGYRKTITTEIVSDIPRAGLTEGELVKETAILATQGTCREALRKTDFKVMDGVVEIAPIEGWAGVSIALCSC